MKNDRLCAIPYSPFYPVSLFHIPFYNRAITLRTYNYMKPKDKKKKSRFGKGLMAGALFGIAAGIFMSSKEGKRMADKLQKQAKEIESRLRNEFKKKKELSEQTYAESIDSVLAYYMKSRKIAKSEIPALRNYLMGKWKLIKMEMKDVPKKKPVKKTAKKTAKKSKKR